MMWRVTRWRAVDGDTVDMDVERTEPLAPGWRHSITNDEPYHVRLITIDTPERGQLDYRRATNELAAWLTANAPLGLRVETYDSAGWDRDLADVWAGDRSNTATQAMLRAGWPVYVP